MRDNFKINTLNICPVNIMNLRLVIIWASLYAVLWTIVTVSLDPAVPYDAVEALNWAQNGEWGSPKNPWLVGLVMRPAVYLPANIYWYASHFLAIALGMVGSWVLAHRLTGSNMLAWFALLTINLSGLINFDIISYNDNYLLVMLWPWMMYCYLLAISRNLYWWLAFALLAGLATMSKYSTLILVGSVFLSTLFVADIRRCYRHAVWYCALGKVRTSP
jgi:4-amino-4-deoxy-L-arabinose transferase-like glycosyltransferase